MAFETESLYEGKPIRIEEEQGTYTRETGENQRIERTFWIRNAADEGEAHNALVSWLYEYFQDDDGALADSGVRLKSIVISATGSPFVFKGACTFEETDDGSFDNGEDSNINDESYTLPNIEDSDYTFSTSGGSIHTIRSLATSTIAATGEVARSFGGFIGYNGDGFDGTDIAAPACEFSIGISLPKRFLNSAYRVLLANWTGCINSQPWNGFNAYCVQFKGVNAKVSHFTYTNRAGREIKDWYWRAEYSFQARPPEEVIFAGVSTLKSGFDYAWYTMGYVEDLDGGYTTAATALNIERVYRSFPFQLLGLPLPS